MGSAYSDIREFKRALPFAEKAIYNKKLLKNKTALQTAIT